jgi:hypothetical protein
VTSDLIVIPSVTPHSDRTFRVNFLERPERHQVGKKLGAKGVVKSIKLGKLFIKFIAFTSLQSVWNNWMFPDAEDSLPEEMRRRSHLILWHTKGEKPQIIYFPRVGVVGDLLEWAGMDTAIPDIADLITGKEDIKSIVDKYDRGFENLKQLGNKIAQSIGPQFKMPMEFVMKEKFFPSVWERQPITNRWDWFFDNFSLGSFTDVIFGRPTRPADKLWGKHWRKTFSSWAIYSEDQNRLAWLAIRQKIQQHKAKHKLDAEGFMVTEAGTALYNAGLAWRYGDGKAFDKYLVDYLMITVGDKLATVDLTKVVQDGWKKLEPLNGLNELHKNLFIASLNEREQKQFALAMEYYAEIKAGLQFIPEN